MSQIFLQSSVDTSVKARMVKLTVDLIEGAGQYINPIRDRELDLRLDFPFFTQLQCTVSLYCRGYKIPVIENLGTTMDQFDCIDFSDNEIRYICMIEI